MGPPHRHFRISTFGFVSCDLNTLPDSKGSLVFLDGTAVHPYSDGKLIDVSISIKG